MKKVDTDLLEIMTDDEIKILINETKTDIMLVPFKQNSKTYAKYITRLGRMDAKSNMTKVNLPGIVFELYKKGDLNMKKLLSIQAQNVRDVIIEILKNYPKEEISIEKFSEMDSEHCVSILLDIEENAENLVDIELFFLQLKLNLVELSEQQKNEIVVLWNTKKEIKLAELQKKQEIESALKKQEDQYKSSIRNLKKELDSKVNSAEQELKKVREELSKQIERCEKLAEQNKQQKSELQQKEKVSEDSANRIVDLSKELSEKEKEIAVLKEKNEKEKKDFQNAWKEEIEAENIELTSTRDRLKEEKSDLLLQMDLLIEDKCKTEEELKMLKESILASEERLQQLENDIEIKFEQTKYRTKLVSDGQLQHVGEPSLYIEQGTNAIQKEVCKKYGQYLKAVETNLKQIGCKVFGGELEDFFNATIDVGLIPLLCGFGSRKAAMALIAARYGEIPTIISIPTSYYDVDSLSREIDEAETDVIIIEDLFGSMNEEIILPVLRRDIDKQLVFCAESTACFKYVDSYFLNYIQILKINITTHKKMQALVFADARELFGGYQYSEKSEMHKTVKKLFNDINISDTYIQTRGDILTYLNEIAQHSMGEAFGEWFYHEVLLILRPEERQIIKERLTKDSLGISEELIESLA